MWTPANKRQLLGFSQTGDLGPYTVYTSKRRQPVWFYKAPPQKPPSDRQIQQRLRFTMAAEAWQQMAPQQRQDWADAARLANLYLSGYNLWIYFQITRDTTIIRTLEHQTSIALLPN